MLSRRHLVQNFLASMVILPLSGCKVSKNDLSRKKCNHVKTTIYRSVHGLPAENISKVIDMMGGIEKLIGPDDVVMIKPNIQWWNQGSPNLAAVNSFISLIMERPGGFRGEVILAENNHRGHQPWLYAGWSQLFTRNADLPDIQNYNQLCKHLKTKYEDRFSVCHWIDIGSGAKRVYSPEDGAGYVLCDGTGGVPLLSVDNGLSNEKRRTVIMSYPIFKTDRGTIIDFKNGIWHKGSYTSELLKFINCSALNHHSYYCGPTSAVKNHLGISDLTGGPDPANGGRLTGQYYNFHSFPLDKWAKGPVAGVLGLEIGMFLKTIRKPDLNLTTAEWVGLASRTEPPVAHIRAICASTDPVALDYHTAKYFLYPNSRNPLHHPEYQRGPFYSDLVQCSKTSGCIFNEEEVDIQSFDLAKNRFQKDHELPIQGDIFWGTDVKSLLKYFIGRV